MTIIGEFKDKKTGKLIANSTIELTDEEFECLKFLVEDSVKFHKQFFEDVQDGDLLNEIGASKTKEMFQRNSSLFEALKRIGFDIEKFE